MQRILFLRALDLLDLHSLLMTQGASQVFTLPFFLFLESFFSLSRPGYATFVQ